VANEYLEQVVNNLTTNPTSQDLDFFLVAHAKVGQLVATARNLADEAEARAKVDRASAYAEARRNGAKSATDAEAMAIVESSNSERAAISARERYQKLAALHRSIEEVINGIKFLGRNDGTMTLPRR
jgi:threonine synthase